MIKDAMNKYFFDCINQVLQQVALFISKVLFDPKQMPDFFKKVMEYFLGLV